MEGESFLGHDAILASAINTRAIYSTSNPFVPSAYLKNDLKKKIKSTRYSSSDIKVNSNKDSSDNNKSSSSSNALVTFVPSPAANDSQLSLYDENGAKKKNIVPSMALDVYYKDKKTPTVPVPNWHAPWQLSSVLSGHYGWVRCIAFDPSNEWFVTGSADRTIKVWDLAKSCAGVEGALKLTLTGHISTVRGLAVSHRHPYLFSAAEDKTVKCWDLEYNKVIRHYHGHLSGVFEAKVHPTLDILVTGGRDSVARVWDIRTKHQIHCLSGHTNTVGCILTNAVDPQIITGSQDATIRLWDLAAGKTMCTLSHHKKGIRSLAMHPKEFSFLSGAADNIKKWQAKDGKFLKNFTGHNSIVNAMAVNADGVAVSCGDNGSMGFWDYETGYSFQQSETIPQPGSLDAEAGIYAAAFDMSGSRLITCEADKSIKVWKENEEATELSHPIDMDGWTRNCLRLKRY